MGALALSSKTGASIRRGIVLFHNPGTHWVAVVLDNGVGIACIPPDAGSGSMYGVGSVYSGVLESGTPVVVLQYGKSDGAGVILCVYGHQMVTDDPDKFKLAKSDESAAFGYKEENSYSLDSIKRNFRLCGTGMYKASDTYQGDWMVSNEFGMEYFLGRSRATIRGSNLSRIDFFPIDDVLRITAGYLQEYTHAGVRTVFADKDGYVSEERLFSPYAWETGGCETKDAFESKVAAPEDLDKQPDPLDNPDLARYREYQGSVAGGRQIFVSCPKGGKNVGLSHVALSDSGAVVVRSTSDIVFSTTSRIDVPVRVKSPEDPEGVDVPKIKGKDETPEDAEWWEHDLGRRTASNIIAQLYRRFRDNDKDWRIDSSPAVEDYDEHAGSKADVGGGVAQLFLGHDGSIVLSTSEGAEIRLHGKDITISCPGTLSLRSGSEVSVLSAGNIVSKSKENTEILSSGNTLVEADHRLAAFGGISIFAEVGDSGEGRNEDFANDRGGMTPGLYLKVAPDKGHILLDSDTMFLHPRKTMLVVSQDKNGDVPGDSQILVGVGQVVASTNTFLVNAGESEEPESGIVLAGSTAAIFGSSVAVAGESVPAVVGGGMMPWYIPADGDPYKDLVDQMEQPREQTMFTKYDAIADIPWFSYREYLGLDGGAVQVEESPWVNFQNASGQWGKDLEVNKTLPWPGKNGRCVSFKKDYSGLKDTDDAFGDKEDPVAQPEKKVDKFEKFLG